ncbi:MAG: hypothetical protein AAB338_02035 [Patescibacteria group bacterium]
MKLRKWVCVVAFDAREDDDYIEGYVKQHERVFKLQQEMMELVGKYGKELGFRQFYWLSSSDWHCGVAHFEVDPKEVEREAHLFSQIP